MRQCPTCKCFFPNSVKACEIDMKATVECPPIEIKYELQETISQGGMGRVYKATNKDSGSLHAIKFILSDKAGSPELLKRFEQEAYAGKTVKHPNVVEVTHYGRQNEIPFIVMEYIEGETLEELLKREKRL
jgi:eukaryotic-like serine/threonine-protein kinase